VVASKASEPVKTLVFEWDGQDWPYVRGRNTARITRDVRQTTGMSLNRAEQLMGSDADLDVVVALLCAAMLQQGVTPDYEDLLDRVSPDSPLTVKLVDGVPDPEPHGGS
jgi:hypothetical protein